MIWVRLKVGVLFELCSGDFDPRSSDRSEKEGFSYNEKKRNAK